MGSGVTMGYVAIELIFNYLIHIFFLYACIKLFNTNSKIHKLYILITLGALYLLSFIFAFKIIQLGVFFFLLLYGLLFYKLFKEIKEAKTQTRKFNTINKVGFFISLAWFALHFILLF